MTEARQLRKRLAEATLPLAIALTLVVAISAPTAYYVLRVRDARSRAAAAATNVSAVLRRDAASQPRLWKYNSIKILRHVREFQLQTRVANVLVVDAAGAAIEPNARATTRGPAVWSSAPIRAGANEVGRVWVAVSTADARRTALLLLLGFGLLGAFLGGLMYLLPLRVLAGAETQLRAGERLRALSGRSAALEQTERRAIARDLHDSAGQTLTAIRINLQLIADSDAAERVAELARTTMKLTDETLEEIRRAVQSLGPAILDDVGLEKALERMCNDVAERSGLDVKLRVDAAGATMSAAVETACYRIVQEALTNVERHAGAGAVQVTVDAGANTTLIQISDDGRGFDPRATSTGNGLASMRARAELLGGRAAITSSPEGCTVRAELPTLPAGADQVASTGD